MARFVAVRQHLAPEADGIGQRFDRLLPEGAYSHADLHDEVFTLTEAPHDWLFPRMAAVVHHGGAGTTAAGLRTGVPTIMTPVYSDQFFWSQRLATLGVGPPPIPQKHLTAERLAAALRLATSDQAMQERARAVGREHSERKMVWHRPCASSKRFLLHVQPAR